MMKTVEVMKKTINLLQNNDNFLIITHKKPDGDTLGSAGALCGILRKLGKNAFILKNPEVTPKYEKYVSEFYPSDDFSPDFVVTVDIATPDLFTDNAKAFEIDLCIDHHFMSNKGFATHNLIVDRGACGEIIYDISCELGVEIDKQIATAIYVSVSTDTGCFKYSNTTTNTHKVAGNCLNYIENVGEINRVLFDVKTKSRVKVERHLLDVMEFHFDSKVNIVTFSLEDRAKTGALEDDLDNIAAFSRSIEGVEVAITLQERKPNEIKASLRSSGDVNVSEICAVFGGGGHQRASGATFFDENFEEIKQKLLNEIKKVI